MAGNSNHVFNLTVLGLYGYTNNMYVPLLTHALTNAILVVISLEVVTPAALFVAAVAVGLAAASLKLLTGMLVKYASEPRPVKHRRSLRWSIRI